MSCTQQKDGWNLGHTIFLQILVNPSDNCFRQRPQDWPMKTLLFVACSLIAAVVSVLSLRGGAVPANLVEQATSTNQNAARRAHDQLRESGPQGLVLLEKRFAKEISARRRGSSSNDRWTRISAALDRVGGQYDNYASGLYWYTDLEKAKAAARATGRPILSLRLLGHLDEDLSCANSRFFRTTLYPDAEINKLLKERFILHWQSVRPAPRVTIEFGDGRKLQRTITGNSIHYILDADGRFVDALPGLYGAPVFKAELQQTADAIEQIKASPSTYAAYRNSQQQRLLNAWAADVATLKGGMPARGTLTEAELEHSTSDGRWQQIAELHWNNVIFDPNVRQLVATKFPDAQKAAPIATSKMSVENPMLRVFGNLSRTTSLDTVRNNYLLRTRILAQMNDAESQKWSLAQLNDWVYAQIFLTPNQDPWLGLAPPDVFAAIDGNGKGR